MAMQPNHLIILPIVLPLAVAALLLLFDERRHTLKALVNLISTFALFGVALFLMRMVDAEGGSGMAIYRLGDWAPPFGIVLVVDRLSALMLVLTSLLSIAALIFSLARWHREGSHFHTLFQFLLVGLNGAFLTGDLFNLFVFFEVLLAASYGLVLHGFQTARVRAGLQYIAVNLAGSSLLLIGISLIYGVSGTLNMADLALRVPALTGGELALAEAGAGILGVAFLLKAGMWPLGFWLPTTYTAASAPVAAIFAIMSKVGVYAILRLWLLVFGPDSAEAAQFGSNWLLLGGMLTIIFGSIGVLASQSMGRLAGYSVAVSSGTLLTAIGTGNAAAIGGTLFYLVSSTLTISAFFLLIELVERGREPGADVLAVTMEAFGDDEELDKREEEVGVAIPGAVAVLGAAFVGCALLLAGMPPLSGFIAKFAILTALFNPAGLGTPTGVSATTWTFTALLIFSGLSALIALTRTGIRTLWVPFDGALPRIRVIEVSSVAFLLLLCGGMTVQGGPVMRYMEDTARFLRAPQIYVHGVLPPAPAASAGIGGAR